jgi:hypothetical protein
MFQGIIYFRFSVHKTKILTEKFLISLKIDPCSENSGNELFVAKNVKYFADSPNLKWTKTTYDNLRSINGVVKVNNHSFFRSNITVNNFKLLDCIALWHTPCTTGMVKRLLLLRVE